MRIYIKRFLVFLLSIVDRKHTGNRKKENFPVVIDGETYWISRSVAVAGFVYANDANGKLHVLAEKRGEGCPTMIGYWCCPCGYVGYSSEGDTSGEHAIAREIKEETGVIMNPNTDFKFQGIEFSNHGNENITIRYSSFITNKTIEEIELSDSMSEIGEIADLKWVPYDEISNYHWAFGHLKLIQKFKP